jgi:DNA-directed RNA polymerase specialized sigma24 family protein
MAEPGRKADPAVAEVMRVYDALKRFARQKLATLKCYGDDAMLPGLSTSAEDLAADTIVKLHIRGWVPGSEGDDILPLAYVILKNKFTDVTRSPTYRRTVSLDSGEIETLREAISTQTPHTLIEWPLVVEKMKLRLGTDELAKKYLDASLRGARNPKEFADELGISVQEAENVKKRLIYRAEKMRELWERVQQ